MSFKQFHQRKSYATRAEKKTVNVNVKKKGLVITLEDS